MNSISYDTYLQAQKKVYTKYKFIREYRENIKNDYNDDIQNDKIRIKLMQHLGMLDN